MIGKERRLLSTFIVALYASVTLFVLLYLIWNSFRYKQDLLSHTFALPHRWTLQNYTDLFTQEHFLRSYWNSVIILAVTLVLTITLSSMVAYGLGQFRFRGKNAIQTYFLLGLMFPIQLGIVPIFLIIRSLGLLNSLTGVILILSAGISMPVLMLTNFFSSLPQALYESSKVDGAGEWTTFYRIMLPLASPIIVSICIVLSVGIWNQFFIPLIFLQKQELHTVPLAVLKYTGNIMLHVHYALAASVLATIPILILFFIFSERVIEGVSMGAVKE